MNYESGRLSGKAAAAPREQRACWVSGSRLWGREAAGKYCLRGVREAPCPRPSSNVDRLFVFSSRPYSRLFLSLLAFEKTGGIFHPVRL